LGDCNGWELQYFRPLARRVDRYARIDSAHPYLPCGRFAMLDSGIDISERAQRPGVGVLKQPTLRRADDVQINARHWRAPVDA
jgi:hypothetical protein